MVSKESVMAKPIDKESIIAKPISKENIIAESLDEIIVGLIDNEVTQAKRQMLQQLYPDSNRNIIEFYLSRRKIKRNAILNRYEELSNSLRARGFDTTILDNTITDEQTKTNTVYEPP